MEALHPSIGRITTIPTADVTLLLEDEIIDVCANSNAQDHDEREEAIPSNKDDENNDEPETHIDSVWSNITQDHNHKMMVQNRMLLKLLFEQQA